MSSAVARVAALGGSAAARGGGYCALCLATGAERRLVAPRQLEHLVRQLVLHMPGLTPIASSLTWGARACSWCETRCAGATRVLCALAAAARAHALLARLDAGVDAAGLEPKMAAADEGVERARGPALRTTDVLLIDTRLDVMQLQPEGYIAPPPPIPAEIETVVIEDDPPEPPPPPSMAPVPAAVKPLLAAGARAPVRLLPKFQPAVTNPKLQSPLTNVAPKPVAANTPPIEQINSRKIAIRPASEDAIQAVLTRNVTPAPAAGPAPLLVPVAPAVGPAPLLVPAAPAVGPVFPPAPPVAPAVGPVFPPAPPVAPAVGPVFPPAPPVAPAEQVLMVLPPGAQIVSRLDGMGPKYLLLQQPPPAAPPPPPLPPGPPGACTVSCESDDDSNDGISLSQLMQRRDEFNQQKKPTDSNKNNNKTNNDTSEFNFYNTSDMGFITDVKSLSETNKTKTNSANEQCYITNVKSLSGNMIVTSVCNSGNMMGTSVCNSGNMMGTSVCNSGDSGKRSSDVTKQSKKAKGDGYEPVVETEARAPQLNTDRVDWEDKIPMDVISFVDATDPCAKMYLPQPARVLNTVSTQSKRLPAILNHTINNCVTSVQNCVTSVQNCVTSTVNCVTSTQNCVTSAQHSVTSEPEGPRPLALISNITSATGEKSVVIDLC